MKRIVGLCSNGKVIKKYGNSFITNSISLSQMKKNNAATRCIWAVRDKHSAKIIVLFHLQLKLRQAVMSIVIISGLVICKHLWQSELKFLKTSLNVPWLPPSSWGSSCSNCSNTSGGTLLSEQELLQLPTLERPWGQLDLPQAWTWQLCLFTPRLYLGAIQHRGPSCLYLEIQGPSQPWPCLPSRRPMTWPGPSLVWVHWPFKQSTNWPLKHRSRSRVLRILV